MEDTVQPSESPALTSLEREERLKQDLIKSGQWMEPIPGQGMIVTGAYYALEYGKKLKAEEAQQKAESQRQPD